MVNFPFKRARPYAAGLLTRMRSAMDEEGTVSEWRYSGSKIVTDRQSRLKEQLQGLKGRWEMEKVG